MSETIRDVVTTGGTPGSLQAGIAPIRGQNVILRADPTKEYVAGNQLQWLQNYARTLSWAIDDVTQDFGDDLYERMMLYDGIFAPLYTLKLGVLEGGPQLGPAIDDEEDPQYAQAKEIADFCQRVLDDLPESIDDVLLNMLDAMALGNKVAEITYGLDTSIDPGSQRLVVQSIKVKPRTSTAFIVDAYYNVLGLLGLIPGQGQPVLVGTILSNLDSQPNLLPREKFAVLTWRPKDNDPRGTSLLRPAYDAWWQAMQLAPEYLKYLTQFAGPSLIGTTPENAMEAPQTDADGQIVYDPTTNLPVMFSPEQVMLNQLITLRNATAMVKPCGSEVEPLQVQGNGEAFLSAFDRLDRRMTRAILHQTLATMEAEHGTRAQASVHQDTLQTIIKQAKKSVSRMIRRDILGPMVRFNWGDEAATLVPNVTLGETETQDLPAVMTAVAALQTSTYVRPEQRPGIDKLLGLDPTDMEALALEEQQQQAAQAQQAQMALEVHKATLAAGSNAPASGQKPPAPQPTPDKGG